MIKLNTHGNSILSVLISLGVISILMLGLVAMNNLAIKSVKNVSLDYESLLEMSRIEMAFSDIGKSCKKSLAGKFFQDPGSSATKITDIQVLKDNNNNTLLSSQTGQNTINISLKVQSISVENIKKLNINAYQADLIIIFKKSDTVRIGYGLLTKKFPLFLKVTTDGVGKVTIDDCGATSQDLLSDLQKICSSISGACWVGGACDINNYASCPPP